MSGTGKQIQIFQGLTIYRPGLVYQVASLQTIQPTPPDMPDIYIHDQNPLMSNPEVFIMAFLLLTLPILVYLAYRYGKKMGRKEHTPSDYRDVGPEVIKRGVSQESTSENSANYQEEPNSKRSSVANSPVFNSMPSPPSSGKKDSPLSLPLSSGRNKFELSPRTDEEKIKELSLNDHKSFETRSEGRVAPSVNKVDHVGCSNNINNLCKPETEPKELGIKLLKEKSMRNSKEDQEVNKEIIFLALEKKDESSQETEKSKVCKTYDHKADESENKTKIVRKASQASQNPTVSTNLFSVSPKGPAPEKTQPSDLLARRVDSKSPPLSALRLEEKTRLQTEESKIETVIEKYGVPDETGKFKKIFKDVEWIGEGSFGKVCKVVHRLDGKNYAVKKVNLKLGRFEDLKRESKVFREVFAMTDLHHPSIVRYSTCWVEIEWDKDTPVNRQKTKGYNDLLTLGDISENEVSAEEELSELDNEPAYVSKSSDLGFDWEASAESPEKTRKKNEKNEKALEKFVRKPTEKRTPKHAKKGSQMILKTLSKSFMEEDYEDQSKNSSLSKIESMCEIPGCKLYLYIQMEYCAGQSLKYYLENPKRRVVREKALEMFKKLLEGVNAIHSRGILHRDLKPANIFLDGNENVKIGDFGLASLDKFEETFEGLTPRHVAQKGRGLHSMKVGTPMYTSPEQESGGHYDQKTDIYSLGLIFYEMLVNFVTNHERYEHFGMIREKHEVPSAFRKNFAAESEIILKMTSRLPVERPTAGKIILEVEKLLEEAKFQASQRN